MKIEQQREKIAPWMPAVASGAFTVLAIITSIWAAGRGADPSVGYIASIGMLPFFFFLVGQYLVKLKKEIAELRERLDAADHRSESSVASSEHRPENDSGEQGDAGKPEPVAN
jgi:Na+/melibiose symporter-like transporter